MIQDNHDLSILRELILKAQQEPLSDSEIAQLNEIAQTEAGAQEAVVLIDQLCGFTDASSLDSPSIAQELIVALGDDADSPSRGGQSPVAPAMPMAPVQNLVTKDRRSSFHWLLLLVASNILIGSLAWSFARGLSSNQAAIEMSPPTASAQFVSMTACVWRSSGQNVPALGVPMKQGESLELVEGIAEIRVGEGTPGEALVRIEGPASIFIRGDGQLGLNHGTLTAKSLGTGSGNVMVNGPIGEVRIDGQSSVGMISTDTLSELHVFSGQASVRPLKVSSSNEIRLNEGEAVRFSSKSGDEFGMVMFEASLSRFVSARSSGFDALNTNDAYAAAIMESGPSVYWRFEELNGQSPFHVVNLGSAENMDAAVIGEPGWRQYGKNHVSELGRLGTSSGFCSTGLWPKEPLDQYTVELWVKPELYHHGEIFCMHERIQNDDGRYSHTMMLETLATLGAHWKGNLRSRTHNSLRFVHRTPASGSSYDGSSVVSKKPYRVRNWQHLAAIKQEGQMALWLDGRLSAEAPDPSPLNPNMQIVMGQLYLSSAERRFVGQVDEVAVYDRALSPDELQKHIQAAGRKVAAQPSKK